MVFAGVGASLLPYQIKGVPFVLTNKGRALIADDMGLGWFFLFQICWHLVLFSAQGWNNRTPISHEQVDSRFLVLPGSESTINEITE